MKFLIVLSVVVVASCSPVVQDESVLRLFLGNVLPCVNSDLGLCLKEQALKATERLRTIRQLKITDSITLLNNGPKEAKSLDLSTEPEERKRQITDRLWESSADLLKNSDLELSFDASEDEPEESRALDNGVEEGRGKKKEIKKKIKMLLPLVILAKAKAIALVVISLIVIAISLAKLAFLAKIAFIAKLIAILKHILHKKHHEEEHGWIPHHEEHVAPVHGWESGWSRSRNEGNNLAYSAYVK